MARIRTIKPEFPQSESMGRVSRDARLTFIELWTLADDSGRLRGSSRLLASLLFPYDSDAPDLIDGWLAELDKEGCIRRYKHENDTYIEICNWRSHQKIDRPSDSKIPAFDESSRVLDESSRVLVIGSRIKDQGSRKGSRTKEGMQGEESLAPIVAARPKLAPAESEAYKAIVDAFHADEASWKIIAGQGDAPKLREMRAAKDIAKRIAQLCPDAPGDFARTSVATFFSETRKGKGGIQASTTPCSLNTAWIWGRVLAAMQEYHRGAEGREHLEAIASGAIKPEVQF